MKHTPNDPWVIAYWATTYPIAARLLKVKRLAGAYRRIAAYRRNIFERAVSLSKKYGLHLSYDVKKRWFKCKPTFFKFKNKTSPIICRQACSCPWCYSRQVAKLCQGILNGFELLKANNDENVFCYLISYKTGLFTFPEVIDSQVVVNIKRAVYFHAKLTRAFFRFCVAPLAKGVFWNDYLYIKGDQVVAVTFAAVLAENDGMIMQQFANLPDIYIGIADKTNLTSRLIKFFKISHLHLPQSFPFQFWQLFHLPRLQEKLGIFRNKKTDQI